MIKSFYVHKSISLCSIDLEHTRFMSQFFVLGYFGYESNQLDGQTVKTRDVYRLIQEQFPNKVGYYDTQKYKVSRLSLIFTPQFEIINILLAAAQGNKSMSYAA